MADTLLEDGEETFIQRLFNFKYLVFVVVVSALVAYTMNIVSGEKFAKNSLSAIVSLSLLVAVVLSFKSKSKKTFIFFASMVLYIVLAGGILFAVDKFTHKNTTTTNIIHNMIKLNDTLPKMLNENLELIKVTSRNGDTIIQHVRIIAFSKQDLLDDYSNDTSLLSKELLKEELRTSCPYEATYELLSTGLTIEMVYYGKDNQKVTEITINHDDCKPYYKQ